LPSWTALAVVNRLSPRRIVKQKIVNRGAPDLFPANYLLKNRYIQRETEGRRAFERAGIGYDKSLKNIGFLSLINCSLNRI
jgi:hypothetical protein